MTSHIQAVMKTTEMTSSPWVSPEALALTGFSANSHRKDQLLLEFCFGMEEEEPKFLLVSLFLCFL